MANASIIQQIDEGLARYYTLKGQSDYNSNFLNWCEEEGYDDEMVITELDGDEEECMLNTFDANFPIDQSQSIIQIIKKCREDKKAFVATDDTKEEDTNDPKPIPTVTDIDWDIDEKDINYVIELNEKQLHTIYSNEMKADNAFLKLLAISCKVHYPYLIYMVDMYLRDRVSNKILYGKDLEITQWMNQNKYFKREQLSKHRNTLHAAMNSFFRRVCPKLQFSSPKLILESLKSTCHYITASVSFIDRIINRIYSEQATLPFQMDVCIIYDEEDKSMLNKNRKNFIPSFDDIKQILSKEKLIHATVSFIDSDENNPVKYQNILKIFDKGFNEFITGLIKTEKQYPQRKRFCLLIDRRKMSKHHKTPDKIIVFQPPNAFNSYPNGEYSSLWNFDASQSYLIPLDDSSSITSKTQCNGSLLIISYHVETEDQIKCYLYLNGAMTRFFPEDITTILPLYFVDNNENKKFIRSSLAENLIEYMQQKINDLPFTRFCDSCQ